MRPSVGAALALLVAGCAAQPEKPLGELEQGFVAALRGCEEWLLNPQSWVKTDAPFLASMGIGDKVSHVETIDEAAKPPKSMQDANRYYEIRPTDTARFYLVVSYQIPMCHISGFSDADLQPVVNTVLSSKVFRERWTQTGEEDRGNIISTWFRNHADKRFNLLVTRSENPGDRTDRTQMMASATLGIPL